MKKSERLNTIIYIIREKGRQSAKALAEHLEVTERTIYRDMDALSQMGVPVIAYEGFGGGYEISEDYFIPSVKLTEDERRLLLMLLKAGEALRIPSMDRRYLVLKQKLLSSIDASLIKKLENLMNRLEFSFGRINPGHYEIGVMDSVLNAIERNTNLLIGYYHPRKDVISKRKISPTKLFHAEGGWYLAAYCHLRQEKRTFRLDRIKTIHELSEQHPYQHEDIQSMSNKFVPVTYHLRMEASLYRIVRDDDYFRDHLTLNEGHELEVLVTTVYKSEILLLAAMHPESVTVLGPETFIEELGVVGKVFVDKYLST